MYRVLLVDDESLTLDYLKMAIPKQDPGWSSASGFTAGIQNRKLSFYPAMTNLNSHSRPFSAVWRIIY